MTEHNPFENGPTQRKTAVFGTLRLFTRTVNLKKGAFYTEDSLGIDPDPDSPINRITDQSGNLREFRGKLPPVPNGKNTHVLPVITTKNRDGIPYNACRDFLLWDTDEVQRVTYPSLKKFFGGSKLPGIYGRGKSAEVHAEVVSIPNEPYSPKQAFEIVKVFESVAEREAAEAAFRAQFQTAEQTPDQIAAEMDGEDPIPWGEDGKPLDEQADKPVGMSKAAAVALLSTLWTASGQDKDAFKAKLEAMPVVLTAVGGIDAPEIQAYLI